MTEAEADILADRHGIISPTAKTAQKRVVGEHGVGGDELSQPFFGKSSDQQSGEACMGVNQIKALFSHKTKDLPPQTKEAKGGVIGRQKKVHGDTFLRKHVCNPTAC